MAIPHIAGCAAAFADLHVPAGNTPLILAGGVAVLFGSIEAGFVTQIVATVPEFFWELSLGLRLLIRGLTP